MSEPEEPRNLPSAPPVSAPDAVTSKSPEAVEAVRKIAEKSPQAGFGIQMALGMASNPIHDKINETHITKALELASTNQANQHSLNIFDRWMHLALVIIVIALGIFLVETFRTQTNILIPMLSAFGGFVAGAAGGVGYAKYKQK